MKLCHNVRRLSNGLVTIFYVFSKVFLFEDLSLDIMADFLFRTSEYFQITHWKFFLCVRKWVKKNYGPNNNITLCIELFRPCLMRPNLVFHRFTYKHKLRLEAERVWLCSTVALIKQECITVGCVPSALYHVNPINWKLFKMVLSFYNLMLISRNW